ncbi:hypothetical protein E5672_13275 [Alteromonas portus]|uniref:Uncharacterized protein n=1 Tax=Alteromonas portus TaxID=2565549 RepID=A0A4U0ZE07_9ALTE|nr:hypothetical protein [Alteromonas portus]TKB02827.1 hypothetical protein E5672_13275 [Alteromonas portus]
MSELRSRAFIALSVVFCGYLWIWGYFLNEKPTQSLAPYALCIDSCTINMEYPVSENFQRSSMHSALNQVFQSYTEDEVGYYISCNTEKCALWVYVNAPSKLPPILRRLENEVSPFFRNDSRHIHDGYDKATFSNYAINLQSYLQFSGIFHATHHQAVPA